MGADKTVDDMTSDDPKPDLIETLTYTEEFRRTQLALLTWGGVMLIVAMGSPTAATLIKFPWTDINLTAGPVLGLLMFVVFYYTIKFFRCSIIMRSYNRYFARKREASFMYLQTEVDTYRADIDAARGKAAVARRVAEGLDDRMALYMKKFDERPPELTLEYELHKLGYLISKDWHRGIDWGNKEGIRRRADERHSAMVAELNSMINDLRDHFLSARDSIEGLAREAYENIERADDDLDNLREAIERTLAASNKRELWWFRVVEAGVPLILATAAALAVATTFGILPRPPWLNGVQSEHQSPGTQSPSPVGKPSSPELHSGDGPGSPAP